MSQANIESVLSARRLDVEDQEHLTALCAPHSIAESKVRAIFDAFRPLSDSIEVYVTR